MIGGFLSVSETVAQNSGFYVFLDYGFTSTGLGIDRQTDERYSIYQSVGVQLDRSGSGYSQYKNTSGYGGLGIGYRSFGGYGFEVSYISEGTYSGFRDKDDLSDNGWSSSGGLKVGLHHSSPVYKNLNWSFAISYCRLDVDSNDFNDIVVEPFRLEYVTKNRHLAFQFSLLSFEAMTTVSKEKNSTNPNTVSFEKSGGNVAIGLGFNSTPIRICAYF